MRLRKVLAYDWQNKKLLLLPFTKVCYVESIFDKGLYDNNENSHAGSSLEDSNVLVVTNNEGIKDKVSSLLKEENAIFSSWT